MAGITAVTRQQQPPLISLCTCSTTADHPLIRKYQISQTGATVDGPPITADRWVVKTPAVNYRSSKRWPFAWREMATRGP